MRLVARFVIGVALVLVLAGIAIYAFRKSIAAVAVERAMAVNGLLNPSATVSDFSGSRLAIAKVTAGADRASPDLAVSGIFLDYDWRAFVFNGKARALTIDGGKVTATIGEDGKIIVAGWSPDPLAKRAPPPFHSLTIKGLDLVAATPEGPASIALSGAFSLTEGGAFDFKAAAAKAGFAPAALTDASGNAVARLGADGSISVKGALAADVATAAGVVRGLDADIEAGFSSWRGFFGEGPLGLEGDAVVTVKSSTIDASATPTLAPLTSSGETALKLLSVAGVVRIELKADGFAVAPGGDPILISADRGDRLLISGGDGPLFERRGDRESLTVNATLEGPVAKGVAQFNAAREIEGPWRIFASASSGAQTISGVSIESFAGAFEGDYASDRLAGDANFTAAIEKAKIGRLTIADMPAAAKMAVVIDTKARTLTATPAAGACLDVDRASFRMGAQDMDARVTAARLCPGDAPLFSVNWGEAVSTHIEGALTARGLRYRLGKTEFDGAPPRVDFTLDYDPAAETTRIAGGASGGRLLLNKAFALSAVKATFEAALVRDAMMAKAALSTMKIAQNAETEMVAPLGVAGVATLERDVSRFDFKVMTPKGVALGRGEGKHQVKTGKGEAVFDSGLLTFTRLGLQPDRLIPALRGVITNASGTAEGRALFQWDQTGVQSSATVNLDDVSFQGPGVAVTRTEGVTGKLVFSSLAPIATAGEQTISIRKIDLDALKLENGGLRFAMPGDETLKIVEGEFPWFGGTIGAYDSVMAIGGGKAETTLQIDNVDLAALLNYLNVDGLSGEGAIEGVLPLAFEGGKARINNGILSSRGAGVMRYEGKATNAASQANAQSALAFEILREIRFEKLSATIDGPLDGTLDFKILFEGRSDIPVQTGKKTQRVNSPVKMRLTINAPLLSLIEQAILSTDVKMQIDRAKKEQAKEEAEKAVN